MIRGILARGSINILIPRKSRRIAKKYEALSNRFDEILSDKIDPFARENKERRARQFGSIMYA